MPAWLAELLKHLPSLSAPALYALTIYGLFHYLDKKASGQAKRAISAWINSTFLDRHRTATVAVEIFDRLYTTPLLSASALVLHVRERGEADCCRRHNYQRRRDRSAQEQRRRSRRAVALLPPLPAGTSASVFANRIYEYAPLCLLVVFCSSLRIENPVQLLQVLLIVHQVPREGMR